MISQTNTTQAFNPNIANTAAMWRPPVTNRTDRVFANQPLNTHSWGWSTPRGYGLDLNGDGEFDPKRDGFMSFDLNRDGVHSDEEIAQSRNLLKAFSGDFDSNGDGRVDFGEYWQGYGNYFQARQMDLDRDGVLSNWELQKAGGAIVQKGGQPDGVFYNQNGSPQDAHMLRPFPGNGGWKTLSLDSLPDGRRLDYLNPWYGTFTTSPNYLSFPYDRINAGPMIALGSEVQ